AKEKVKRLYQNNKISPFEKKRLLEAIDFQVRLEAFKEDQELRRTDIGYGLRKCVEEMNIGQCLCDLTQSGSYLVTETIKSFFGFKNTSNKATPNGIERNADARQSKANEKEQQKTVRQYN